jgi:two-component system cell cycle sensor histidine kinase/response regulator CckA
MSHRQRSEVFMDIPLRVLIIEDSDRDVALEVRALKAAGYQVTYAVAETAVEMKAALAEQVFDIVISDNDMPQFDAQGALAVLKESGLDIPFIIVSGSIGQEIGVALMKAGAHDYVMKDSPDRLVPAIQRELKEAESRKELKRLEKARRSEQIMLARTEGIAHIGSWEWDIAMDTVTWSDELFRIFQRDPREGAPRFADHPAFYHPDDMARLRQAVEAALADGTPYEIELRAIRKDGETRVCVARGVADMALGGRAVSLFGSLQDITERKLAEAALQASSDEVKTISQQLLQAEKLATMGELASSIAHELNNPLATVSLRVESLIAQTDGDDPRRRELEIIEQEVERMGNLVTNLLQFSRRSQQQISTVNVCDEIEKTLELVHYHFRKHNIAVAREFKPEGPLILADRQQLRQLFLNLFTNASDAMPDGGTLTIRVTNRPEEKQICIEIADTGVGIPPEILLKVFEPFYTTKPEGKGTGLGLAICRRIAQAHNGTLNITSEGGPGNGARVCITLPFSNGSN